MSAIENDPCPIEWCQVGADHPWEVARDGTPEREHELSVDIVGLPGGTVEVGWSERLGGSPDDRPPVRSFTPAVVFPPDNVDDLTPEQARAYACALVTAADLAEQINSQHHTEEDPS